MNKVIPVWSVSYSYGEGIYTAHCGENFTDFDKAVKEYKRLCKEYKNVDIIPYFAYGSKDGILYSTYNRINETL